MSAMDAIGIILLSVTGAVTLFMMFYMVTEFNTVAATIPMFSTNAPAMATLGQGETVLKGMDSLFALFVILLCGVAIVGAYLLPTHPVMFIVAFLLTLILIPIAAEFANMFEALYSSGPLMGIESNFPYTVMIFRYLPTITAVVSGLIAILMYGRMQQGVGY